MIQTIPTVEEMPASGLFPDGVYFGLDEDRYHADPALGSTDIKSLRTSGPDYWWGSVLNPNRPEREEKDHLTFGKAMHKMVLEGAEAFLAGYARKPEGDDLLKTDADLAAWLKERGVEKLPKSKADKATLCLDLDPEVRILDEIERIETEAGREILKGELFDRIVAAGASIAENEGLASAFQNGQPEVSVFWTFEPESEIPVRLKSRFDYLKTGGIGDLKTIRNSKNLAFVEAIRRQIADLRYDIQAAHYLNGRVAFGELARDGIIFAAEPETLDPDWIQRVAERDRFGFQWVFIQSAGAPNVKSYTLSPENPIRSLYGQTDVERAIENFRRFISDFGPSRPWRLAEPVEEISLEELPAWFGRS